MIDPSKERSSKTNKISLGERAAYFERSSNRVEPTERDPLLSSFNNPKPIKRRHQSPTFQQTNSSSNPSMTTGQTGPSFHGTLPPSHHRQQQHQQHHQQSYIPPLPGRGQNLLHAESLDSDGNSHRRTNENRQFQDDFRQQYYNERAARLLGDDKSGDGEASTVVEVPEEIYAVRKNALTVMEPLIHTALIFAVGISLSVALGLSRLTQLIPGIPFWIVLLPSWLSHLAMFICQILSAKALSKFISAANENRQRHDSTDHLDRTEYLPLLQRALKFALKTGLLSFCLFVFEILIYFRLADESISLGSTLIPIWIIVICGILDGIICKSQSIFRLGIWLLIFTGMTLLVMKVDDVSDDFPWRGVFSPFVVLFILLSIYLVYIVYGHQVGYFQLTESQLTAGILYSASSLVSVVLSIIFAEVLASKHRMELPIRLFITFLAPLVVALTGLGAWAVCRDEFNRLLLYGGQASVYPMKLRLDPKGWTCAEGKGVIIIPLFGEVSYEPLDPRKSESIELCSCCACYPLEDEDDSADQYEDRTANAYAGFTINQSLSNYTGNDSVLGVKTG